ncbi:MAG: hypothetical protein Q7V15_14330 [Phenylobacterium sp.]|uniref:hypothetical protein n=1 Tax=Phenylobacterium sp. TaxID=1871053 RepID=UPI00271D0EB4|nr:hypothetical protein [Phenylobacterium sp.]MDO8902521.1 hypothetical protein [Phenylobacterium sp.]
MFDSSATAAWAQAFLSFVAIVVSGYLAAKVAGRPTLTARHQRLAALSGLVGVARQIIKAAQAEASAVGNSTSSSPAFDLNRFDRTIDALKTIPILEVSPGILVEDLIELQENLTSARDEMAKLLRDAPSGIGVYNTALFYEGARRHAEELERKLIIEAMAAARAERRWWQP